MRKLTENKKLCILLFILIIVVYNIFDNNRIKVVEQVVEIDNLPQSFEGFTILQLSDLHEKRFGKNQKRLVKKINKIDYDILAMTGDMYNIETKDEQPMLEIIDNIDNKANIFYTPGNHGRPYSKYLEERGVKMLDRPHQIKRGNDVLWVYDFFGVRHFNEIPEEFKDEDIKIGLTHYPWHDDFYTKQAPSYIGEYDLVLSGHYHGGMVRIPFYGAVFVPEINGKGFLPKQKDVSGLTQYGEYKQYISRGLGSNNKLRIFNTPEINVIKLVRK